MNIKKYLPYINRNKTHGTKRERFKFQPSLDSKIFLNLSTIKIGKSRFSNYVKKIAKQRAPGLVSTLSVKYSPL